MDVQRFLDGVESGKIIAVDIDPVNRFTSCHPDISRSIPFRKNGWFNELELKVPLSTRQIGLFSTLDDLMKRATTELKRYGVEPVLTISGGKEAWKSAGFKVAGTRTIGVDELRKSLSQYIVVDVRNSEKGEAEVIPGSVSLSMEDIYSAKTGLSHQRPIAVVCSHGNRSRRAAALLSQLGYDAFSVNGGITLWIRRKYDVVSVKRE